MKLDKGQTRFVEEVLKGPGHIILTGKAGTGKSSALIAAVNAAIGSGKDVLVMAPTAMAASIHRDAGLDSGTIHHAIRWNPVKEPLGGKFASLLPLQIDYTASPDQDRLLVIDEISMVGLWVFDILMRDLAIDKMAKKLRPFDGRRLVMVGDWAQLPPVITKHDEQSARGYETHGAPGECCLYHPCLVKRPPSGIILNKSHRANTAWFNNLNRLRECDKLTRLSDYGIAPIVTTGTDLDTTHLCFTRKLAHQRNQEAIVMLPGTPHTVRLLDGDMELRTGCRVIVTSNRAHNAYINGSCAEFTGYDGRWITLEGENRIGMLVDGNWARIGGTKPNHVDPSAAERGVYKAASLLRMFGEVVEYDARKWLADIATGRDASQAALFADGRITFRPYYPVLPGYALTVHKSQGMTLDKVHVESDVFYQYAPARLPYVAFSRVRDGADVTMSAQADALFVRPESEYAGIMAKLRQWETGA